MNKPRSLADAVDHVARKSAGKDWGLYANLLNHWPEIAGAEYARLSTPVKISFPYQPNEPLRKNGVLTVRLPRGLAMEFSFRSEIIRARVNAFFGYEAFARIALDGSFLPSPDIKTKKTADPKALEVLKEKAAAVPSDEVRQALEKFGEALLTRN